MKPILIVKTGGTYPDMAARYGDFEDWFIARMAVGGYHRNRQSL